MGDEIHDDYIMTDIGKCTECNGTTWIRYDFKYHGKRGHCNKCHSDWAEE